jgi:hypothetical protein
LEQLGSLVATLHASASDFATMAARFATDPDEIKTIDTIAPRGWEHQNLELVPPVNVIRGVPERPLIVANRFW